jgi:hypothetical protein
MLPHQAEDAIASLMNEMREQQGYEKTTTESSTLLNDDETATKESPPRRRLLLLPELENYPNHSYCAGSHSIWNPYVQPTGIPSVSLPSSHNNNISTVSTNPQVEVIRRRSFEKFKQACQEVLQQMQEKPWGISLPIPSMLEKWHMDAKLHERQSQQQKKKKKQQKGSDDYPILASSTEIYQWTLQQQQSNDYYDPILLSKQASTLFIPTFQAEVLKAWKKKNSQNNKNGSSNPPKLGKKTTQVQKALHRCICQALEHFQQQFSQVANDLAMRSTQNRKRPKVQHLNDEHDQVQVSYAGISLRIHAVYFEKLQRLFDRSNVNDGQYSFEEALFCLLCRYDMLQGAGLQAGVPGAVLDALLQQPWNCQMEGFASPLNARYQNFASAFELDRLFGSVGSFFDLDFATAGGCYQANPPFCEGVIAQLARTLKDSLKKSSSAKPLMFVVIVPAWKESPAYQQLLSQCEEFLVHHLPLEQGKHWYAEGTQHRRKRSFRVASFDTSILFYQNEAAKATWKIEDGLLQSLKQAFCQDPGIMDKTIKKLQKQTMASNQVQSDRASKQPNSSAIAKKEVIATRESPKGPSKKKKKGDKKRIFSSTQEESQAQLDLLHSLGLEASDEPSDRAGIVDSNKNSQKKKKRTQR